MTSSAKTNTTIEVPIPALNLTDIDLTDFRELSAVRAGSIDAGDYHQATSKRTRPLLMLGAILISFCFLLVLFLVLTMLIVAAFSWLYYNGVIA
jgi:hypothetical protein